MAETWARLRSIFEGALEQEPSDLQDWLDRACEGDTALRAAVEELLRIDRQAGDFLDRPPAPESDRRTDVRSDRPSGESNVVSQTDLRLGDVRASDPSGGLADAPQRLGPYRLLRRIGQGGLGTVYLAVRDDDTFQRRVVVKLVRRDVESEELQRRLRTERQILAGLHHPHIAELFDGGTTEDHRPYFVMEHIEGVPIDTYCDQHRFSVDERLELFCKVCSAVHYAHQNLIVHRDLKPSNILVTADGNPKLLDFGIAKLLNPELAARELDQTATWLRLMTPHYASPEQVRGKLVGTASDIYSLGVLLYRLLTGQLPYRFDRRSPAEIERILTETDPQRPSTAVSGLGSGTGSPSPNTGVDARALGRQLSGDLDAIVMKALRSAPQQRYSSAERFAADIERYRRGLPVEARQGNWRYRAGKFLGRHRITVAVAGLIVLVLMASGFLLVRQAAQLALERDQAELERQRKQAVLDSMLEVLKVADPYLEGGQDWTVREALESSESRLRRRLREEPGLLAEVLHTTSRIYLNLGLWDRSREQAEEALRLRHALFGDDHPTVAESRSLLAMALAETGQLERATELSAKAVNGLRAPEDRTHLPSSALLEALNNQVTVLCYAEDYASADGPSLEALELARRAPQSHLELRADAIANRATLRLKAEDLDGAAKLYRESIGILELLVDEDHPSLAPALNNLGSALRRSGRLTEAEEVFQRSFDIQKKSLGEAHPSLAFSLNNLGRIKLELNDPKGAADRYRAAMALLERQVGPDHPRMLFLELNLATARIAAGEGSEVAEHLESILPEWRERLGPEHAFILDSEVTLKAARGQ